MCERIALALAVAAAAAVATPVLGEDEFPIVGTYLQNERCKGDGSDPADLRVKITPKDIDSNMGLCSILNKSRNGNTIAAHIECNSTAGVLVGDVKFTIRPDRSLEFVDQDNTYNTILHKCPE